MKVYGKIILVGAGPGNAGLLTLRGREAIENADAVLYDRLVGPEIISFIPDSAIKINVGKSSGNHPIPQNEINDMLLRFAKDGKCAVRLKGGDPYLFGRGAEELAAILEEGIPFEVVPGVSSVIAAPAFAGIPVTHRNLSSSLHIITAHLRNNKEPQIDYESLIKLGGTLIFLMSLETIETVTGGLIKHGMPVTVPAALIERGTLPEQRKVVSTVGEIASLSKVKNIKSPALLVIGSVCTFSEKLDWFSKLPLAGVRIIVTRPKTESTLSQGLRKLGADVIDFPCIRREPLPISHEIFKSITQYGWVVFTSPAGADLFFEILKDHKIDIRSLYGLKFAAVGAKTSAVIENKGINVEYMPKIYNAYELAAGLPSDPLALKPLLLFHAEGSDPKLADILKLRNFKVKEVSAYKTVCENQCSEDMREMLLCKKADLITFTSGSSVQGFVNSLPDFKFSEAKAVCIGMETAKKAEKYGFNVLISKQATIESMIDRIKEEQL